MSKKKIEWLDDDKLSKLSNIEKWSLFDIRKFGKNIDLLVEENEKLKDKIKKNSDRIRKYKRRISQKHKLIKSLILNNHLVEVCFVSYDKKYKDKINTYWNVRIIVNGKVKKDNSLISDTELNNILKQQYGDKISRLKKVEILNSLIGNEIEEGIKKDNMNYFNYSFNNYRSFNDRMREVIKSKLK